MIIALINVQLIIQILNNKIIENIVLINVQYKYNMFKMVDVLQVAKYQMVIQYLALNAVIHVNLKITKHIINV